jgi:hypothetical protein
MSQSPKTFPIALGFGGVLIICFAIWGYYFGQRADSSFAYLMILLGFFVIIFGLCAYIWERSEYYRDRLEVHF